MGRAEQRRNNRSQQKYKTVTYNFTREQLDTYVRNAVAKEVSAIKQKATDDAINTAMVLLFTLPMKVLMDHFWKKSFRRMIPKFTELLLQCYEQWQDGELDMNELTEDLWEYGGVRLMEYDGTE